MSDKDSLTSRSSLPFLKDEDDENDEMVFFIEEDGLQIDYDEYDYEYENTDEEVPTGYTRSELSQMVTFVRSSKDPATGDFFRESKELLWVIQHRCEEAEPGVWAGCWYFTYLMGERQGRRAWVDSMNKRMVKEMGGKAIQVDQDEFCAMLYQKDKGNRAFARGQYKSALDCYLRAESLMGGDVTGMYLVPNQRAELVKVLSNQAECYIRMSKHEDAIIKSTAALQLDKRHQKSMLRRAKGIVYGSSLFESQLAAARAVEDLRTIIATKSQGTGEAQRLLDEIAEKSGKAIPAQQ